MGRSKGFHFKAGKHPFHLPLESDVKIRAAAAGIGEQETAFFQVTGKVGDLLGGELEIVMAGHVKERVREKVRAGKVNLHAAQFRVA